MLRFLGAAVFTITLIGLIAPGGLSAQSKGAKETTMSGTCCCAKCELKIPGQTKCATVVKVKVGDKETVYYLDDASNKKFPHSKYCKGTTDVTVTAKVSEKDGKKFIAISKMEEKK